MTSSAEYLAKLFALDGQVGVVIGGTGILGGALCEGLAQAGATVVVAGRSETRGGERADQIERLGGQATFLPVDVTSRASIQKLLEGTVEAYGQVDMLVNCAGANVGTRYEEVTDEDWAHILESNLTATHIGCQVFGFHMAQQQHGGSILNIGSVSAHLPLSRVYAYSASKAAVVNLTQNVARKFAKRNVRVNTLCPGFFPAEQNREILTDKRRENILKQTPMHRFGEPQELIGCALLLLSRQAGSFITGGTYYVDGGFTAMRF